MAVISTRQVHEQDRPEIGARLRAVREAHGLSQRELARRAGVTNGTVSLIEQDKNSPSVASLKKILDVFPMTFVEFFALHDKETRAIFYPKDNFTVLTEGPLLFRVIAGEIKNKKIQILHERYEPGADTGEEMLKHEGEEGGIVIEGRIELTVGNEVRILGPGDGYSYDANIPHRFRNAGDGIAIVVSACTPPSL